MANPAGFIDPAFYNPNLEFYHGWNNGHAIQGDFGMMTLPGQNYNPYNASGKLMGQQAYGQAMGNNAANAYLYGYDMPEQNIYGSAVQKDSPYSKSLALGLAGQQQKLDFQKAAFDLLKGFLSQSTSAGGSGGNPVPSVDPHSIDPWYNNAQNAFANNPPNFIDTSTLQGLAGGPSSSAYNAMRGQALQGQNQQFKTSMNNVGSMRGRGYPAQSSMGLTNNLLNSNLMANSAINQGLQSNMFNQHLQGANALAGAQGQNMSTQYNINNALLNSGNAQAATAAGLLGQNLGIAGQNYMTNLGGAWQGFGQLIK